jgi:phosphate transport system substrate-binding protein
MKMSNYFGLVLLTVIFLGCSEPSETPTKGNIIVGVDESVYPLLEKEKDSFQSKYPEAFLTLEKTNAADGIVNFINGRYKMLVSSRDFNKKELSFIQKDKRDIKKFKFCFDGITAITSVHSGISEITTDDLKKLFSGLLDGYTAVVPPAKSGVYSLLSDSILSKLSYVDIKFDSSAADVIGDVIKSENKIGFVGLNSVRDSSEIKLLQIGVTSNYPEIDYYQPHPGYFVTGLYPLSRTIYIFLDEVGLGLASGFTTYLTSYEGQKIVLSQNLAPAAVPVKLNLPAAQAE